MRQGPPECSDKNCSSLAGKDLWATFPVCYASRDQHAVEAGTSQSQHVLSWLPSAKQCCPPGSTQGRQSAQDDLRFPIYDP